MARTDNQRSLSRWLFVIAAVLVAARIGVSFLPEKTESESSSLVKWVALKDAKRISSESHKRILYEFSAAWCGPCKMMERDVFNNARTASIINARVIPVRVIDRQIEDGRNSPAVADLQRTYAVTAFPTVVIADNTGAAIDRVEGYVDAAHFEKFISRSHAPRTTD